MFTYKMAERIVNYYEKDGGKNLGSFGANYTAYARAKKLVAEKARLLGL